MFPVQVGTMYNTLRALLDYLKHITISCLGHGAIDVEFIVPANNAVWWCGHDYLTGSVGNTVIVLTLDWSIVRNISISDHFKSIKYSTLNSHS